MPQKDRYKDRIIPIEFTFYDTIEKLPAADRLSIVLISSGSATIKMNGHIALLNSPCVICMSKYDRMELISSKNLSAKSFHFDPWYIKACLAFENLEDDIEIEENYTFTRQMLYLFTKHHDNFQGIFHLSPQNYIHINELMLMIGAETFSQSDGFWTCRIRRMLLQVLNCINDIFADQRKLRFYEIPETNNPATICAEYIHTNYNKNITLKDLCSVVNLNRTSLNQKFKQQFYCTCMEYLLNYRLKIAQELLSNTHMKMDEIAQHCGFKYDTYFTRQFTEKLGISPSAYRKNPLAYTAFEGKPIKPLK